MSLGGEKIYLDCPDKPFGGQKTSVDGQSKCFVFLVVK